MKILSEFKRRNVHRMAALYLAAAWLVMQVLDVVEGKLPLPDWMGSGVIAVLAIGFPIALIISWFYEVTPEGISRDTDEEPARSATGFAGRRVDFVIIAVLCAAVLVFAYDKWWIGPPPERSVAVLPFTNMSAEEDSAYFSDGLADTMLHMLAQVPGLHVPARTSSFQPSLVGLDIGEVGKRLGVSTVLEGSVQLYRDKIRVTAQLIDATDGYHLWSQNFDRDFEDIFAIQDEIAREVVSALKLTLDDETVERLDYGGTDNTEAYTEYLLALDKMNPWTSKSMEDAMPHLQKAIELDPNYARGHAMLGHVYYYRNADTGKSQAIAAARDAAHRALDIAPDLPAALTVLGRVEIWDGNDDKGQQLLRKAVEVDPKNIFALTYYALDLARSELHPAEALAVYRRIIKLNPLEEAGYSGVIGVLLAQGKMSEALETALRFSEVRPDSFGALVLQARCRWSMGEYASAIRLQKKTLALDPDNADILSHFASIYLVMNMVEEARYWQDIAAEGYSEDYRLPLDQMELSFYQQQNEEESFQLARQVLTEYPDMYYIFIPLSVLTEYGVKLGRHDVVSEVLENLYPHLFEDPPRDVDYAEFSTYITALALLRSGDIDRGTHLMKGYLKELDRYDEVYPVEPRWPSSEVSSARCIK
jgi:TolB-like protein/cytochrome c-type biogenesis protein CcmH/NrfG